MKLLLDESSFLHDSTSLFEGGYRIKDFSANISTLDFINGEEFLELVHKKKYIKKFKEACDMKAVVAESQLSPESYSAACDAVGLSILASEQNDFAVVRPPGHHSKVNSPSGFCFFNNIAIATQKLVNEGKRVAIIDIDGHHGDGTQEVFERSDRVLFISIHQRPAFPWSGHEYEKGKGEGFGYTKNFPLDARSGDKEFLEAVIESITIMKEFCPDMVAVSAGFDGFIEDKVLDLEYTLEGYYQCGLLLGESFTDMFAVLEGGYHSQLEECVKEFVRGVNECQK